MFSVDTIISGGNDKSLEISPGKLFQIMKKNINYGREDDSLVESFFCNKDTEPEEQKHLLDNLL
jgi:hypothetical protein